MVIWKLGQTNKHCNLNKMEYHQKNSVYKPGSSYCDLCRPEKLSIIKIANNINKRNDVGNTCMHAVKFLLYKLDF